MSGATERAGASLAWRWRVSGKVLANAGIGAPARVLPCTGLRAWALSLLGLLLCGLSWAQQLQPIPALTARVMDPVGLLQPADRASLEAKLAAFEAEAGPQIVLLLLGSTLPEDIAAYTQRVGDAWKIGRRGVGDGLLVVVARDDRQIWIAPAKALEGAVPDLAARQIVRDHITPAFKRGDFAGGLNAGVDQLIARIRGENLPTPEARGDTGSPQAFGEIGLQELAIFFFVGVPILGSLLTGVFGRRLGALLTGGAAGGLGWLVTTSLFVAGIAGVLALVLVGILGVGAAGRRASRGGFGRSGPPIIFGGGGGGWGSGGGGGGGGLGSGGGGDFGGGGAGGSW